MEHKCDWEEKKLGEDISEGFMEPIGSSWLSDWKNGEYRGKDLFKTAFDF